MNDVQTRGRLGRLFAVMVVGVLVAAGISRLSPSNGNDDPARGQHRVDIIVTWSPADGRVRADWFVGTQGEAGIRLEGGAWHRVARGNPGDVVTLNVIFLTKSEQEWVHCILKIDGVDVINPPEEDRGLICAYRYIIPS